ncbi:MAG TPA: shikimate kinase AroK [Burkholderiales bacterium]|nr:shikimate kinase AroK [Burkholderiales bacterium]
MKPAENIYLVGLMGAGKTTVGKQLAKQTGKTFFDSDQEIKQRTGVSISHIFEVEGESGFRTRESAVLKELTQLGNIVLATGGGAVLSEENRALLKRNGIVIYLRASVNDLWARTRHDKNRPLLQTADPHAKLSELFAFRDPLYTEVADFVIDTSRQSVSSLVHHILNTLEKKKLCAP